MYGDIVIKMYAQITPLAKRDFSRDNQGKLIPGNWEIHLIYFFMNNTCKNNHRTVKTHITLDDVFTLYPRSIMPLFSVDIFLPGVLYFHTNALAPQMWAQND